MRIKKEIGLLLCLLLLSSCGTGEAVATDSSSPITTSTTTAEAPIAESTPEAKPPIAESIPEAKPRPVYTPSQEDVQLWDKNIPLSGKLYLDNYYYAYQEFDDDVRAFEVLHPGVDIVYREMSPNDPGYTYTGPTLERVAAAMDVDIFNTNWFDYKHYADKGALVDLRQYMEADLDFHMESYYTNVFDAYMYKGGQYAFPLSFSYDIAIIDKAAPPTLLAEFNALECVSYPQMIGMFARSGLEGQKDLISGTVFDQAIIDLIVRDYIDYENKTCDFDNARFAAMIEMYYGVQQKKDTNFIPRYSNDAAFEAEMEQRLFADNFLFQRTMPANKQYLFPGFDATNVFSQGIPIVNEYNEIPIYSSDLFAIPANSPNKALAWEFLKYLASEEVQSRRAFSEPVVNRAAFAAGESATITEFLLNDVDADVNRKRDITGDVAVMTQDAIAKHDKWNQMTMFAFSGMDILALTPVFNEIDLFVYGVYTPEQLGQSLQEKISAVLEKLK